MNESLLRPDPEQLGREWEAIVVEEYEQVEAVREWQESDHYQSLSRHFVDDPHRTDDEILNRLRAFSDPDTTWLDIGAGAGRYALPLALISERVIAIDPSPSMVETLQEQTAEHGIDNIETHHLRWPEGAEQLKADLSLMSHVGYDIRDINAFLDGVDQATEQQCIALMMDRAPSGGFTRLWEQVHGFKRQQLPAASEMIHLLLARGVVPTIELFKREPMHWQEHDLRQQARQRLWLVEGSEKDQQLQRLLDAEIADGVTDYQRPSAVVMIRWQPLGGDE